MIDDARREQKGFVDDDKMTKETTRDEIVCFLPRCV